MANEYIRFAEEESLPYSDLVVVEDRFLFLSGLVSEDLQTGELVCGSVTEETNQVLSNLKTILEQYGSDMKHVVRVYVTVM